MQVRILHDEAAFRAAAEPFYLRDPIAHTVELSGLAAPALPSDAVLVTVADAGRVVGAAVRTPPYPLVCGFDVAAADPVAAALQGTPVAAVRGPAAPTAAFVEAWVRRTGARPTDTVEERLHVLGTLVDPRGVGGAARDHDARTDTDLLVDWAGRFFVEAFGVTPRPAAHRAFVTTYLAAGARFVLWTHAGRPVSMAMVRRPVAGVARIGPVYTPDDDRGHGYGSAVTAAAARTALAAGIRDVVLFTDVANPVPNAIYRRLGFVPRADWLATDFAAPG